MHLLDNVEQFRDDNQPAEQHEEFVAETLDMFADLYDPLFDALRGGDSTRPSLICIWNPLHSFASLLTYLESLSWCHGISLTWLY